MRIVALGCMLAGAVGTLAGCGSVPPILRTEPVELAGQRSIEVRFVVSREHQRHMERVVRAAIATLRTCADWLGPLPRGTITLLAPAWHRLPSEPEPAEPEIVALEPLHWWTTAPSMAPELATARSLSRAIWRDLVGDRVGDGIVLGLAELTARRVVTQLF